MSDQKHPVDRAAEYAIYAPLGFALEAKRLLPTFVERGRAQILMAKTIGKFAVDQGSVQAVVAIARLQEQAQAALVDLGLVPGLAEEPTSVHEDHAGPDAPIDPDAKTAPAASAPPTVHSSPAAAELAISDYDSLAASQVNQRLAGLTPAELQAVRDYEAAHRGRRTILGKIAQLEAG